MPRSSRQAIRSAGQPARAAAGGAARRRARRERPAASSPRPRSCGWRGRPRGRPAVARPDLEHDGAARGRAPGAARAQRRGPGRAGAVQHQPGRERGGRLAAQLVVDRDRHGGGGRAVRARGEPGQRDVERRRRARRSARPSAPAGQRRATGPRRPASRSAARARDDERAEREPGPRTSRSRAPSARQRSLSRRAAPRRVVRRADQQRDAGRPRSAGARPRSGSRAAGVSSRSGLGRAGRLQRERHRRDGRRDQRRRAGAADRREAPRRRRAARRRDRNAQCGRTQSVSAAPRDRAPQLRGEPERRAALRVRAGAAARERGQRRSMTAAVTAACDHRMPGSLRRHDATTSPSPASPPRRPDRGGGGRLARADRALPRAHRAPRPGRSTPSASCSPSARGPRPRRPTPAAAAATTARCWASRSRSRTTPTSRARSPRGARSAIEEPAEADSEVVRRLRTAGAVILGKTNVPELMITPFTESPTCGITRNPWDLQRTPGGSSGGSAAAVAAGLCSAALGSDGGGSIRIPAGCCGLFGLKPQRGRVPTRARLEPWHGLSIWGPITRRVADSARCSTTRSATAASRSPTRPAREPGRLRIAVSRKVPPALLARPDAEQLGALEGTAELLRYARPRGRRPRARLGAARGRTSSRATCAASTTRAATLPHPERLARRTRGYMRLGGADPARGARAGARAGGGRPRAHRPRLRRRLRRRAHADVHPPPARWSRYDGRGAFWTLNGIARWVPYRAVFNHTGQPAAAVPAGFARRRLPAVGADRRPPDGEGAALARRAARARARLARPPAARGLSARAARARRAGRARGGRPAARGVRRPGGRGAAKSTPTDLVSAADEAAEELIRARLRPRGPTTGSSARRAATRPAAAGCAGSSTRSTARSTSCSGSRSGRSRSRSRTRRRRSPASSTTRRATSCGRPSAAAPPTLDGEPLRAPSARRLATRWSPPASATPRRCARAQAATSPRCSPTCATSAASAPPRWTSRGAPPGATTPTTSAAIKRWDVAAGGLLCECAGLVEALAPAPPQGDGILVATPALIDGLRARSPDSRGGGYLRRHDHRRRHGFCVLILILAFLVPRLSRHPERGGQKVLGLGGRGAGKAPGPLGRFARKPFDHSQKAVSKSGSAGRKGRAKMP